MIPELTVRTRLGAVDLVPFMRRDDGDKEAEIIDWERKPAAIALHARGWSRERIVHATGLHTDAVDAVLSGVPEIRRRDETPVSVKRASVRSRRLEERVMRDGHWYHPGAPHGTASGHKHWGCRCEQCRAAKPGPKPRTVRAGTGYQHGTYSAYQQRKCRCDLCSAASAAYRKSRITALRTGREKVGGRLVHPMAPHGTKNGYGNYGCRCVPCFNSQSEANRKRRQKAAA
jgi:hypothetical protein